MSTIIKFGEDVEGYSVPVLNEREIRAAAGLLFVMMFLSILVVVLKNDFLLLKFAIPIFLADISIRVLVNPKFSPSLIIGRLIVSSQTPEYVGAPQKKFAWIIGLVLAATIFIHVDLLNARGPVAGIICLICLVFLFFETAFGICLGCKFYPLFHKEQAVYCPGDTCERTTKHDIQKTSMAQMLIVLAFFACIALGVVLFHDAFSIQPYDILGLDSAAR